MKNKNVANVKRGAERERNLAHTFSTIGFGAFLIPKTFGGSQPIDLIAVRGSVSVFIDNKRIKTTKFPIRDIQDNQRDTMYMLFEKNSIPESNIGFAIYSDATETAYFLHYTFAKTLLEQNIKVVEVGELITLKEMLIKRRNRANYGD